VSTRSACKPPRKHALRARMRIGLDFDNTIACYDAVFESIARERGYVSQSWSGPKAEVRVAVRSRPQGELDWQRLQGQVYGKYMHLANVFPEVANFLLRSKARNDELFIVSHKTEFGHYDPDKIPLREEALRWMRANRFFGASGLGLSEENVFFANTREEKIGEISRLKCEVFIDDLWEVFAEPGFPNETRKILFQPESYDHNPKLYALISDSWREIAQCVFGVEEDVEEIEKQIGFAVGGPIKSVSAVVGRANSRIFKVEVGKESLAAKFYPDRARDPRDRLSAERNASEFVGEYCTESALEFVGSTPALNMSLYRWVEGVAVTDILKKDIRQALEFVAQLHVAARAPSAEMFPVASEACLCEEDLWSQIGCKRRRLDKVMSSSGDLGRFLTEVFDPLASSFAR
ncbi:MAG: phosphotransferase enzyme domain protein, partial [Gammaproteobacteria bacterium]